jgi:hypothetical protein
MFPYQPKEIVIYCGDNDLAASDTVSAQTVFERFKTLYEMIRKKLATEKIVYVSIKPSPSREKLMPKMEEANQLIKDFGSAEAVVCDALGGLRTYLAQKLNLVDPAKKDFKFAWVLDFPMFTWDDEEKRWAANHHPFTAPRDQDLDKLESDPGKGTTFKVLFPVAECAAAPQPGDRRSPAGRRRRSRCAARGSVDPRGNRPCRPGRAARPSRLLECVFDRDSPFEIGRYYGRPIVTFLARLNGYPVGVLASDPQQGGGGLDAPGSEKMTWKGSEIQPPRP